MRIIRRGGHHEASPSFSVLGHPQALCSRALWLFRVWRYSGCMVSWCSTTQSISVFSRITRSSLGVSLLISRLPSHSSGVLCGIVSLFFLQFLLEEASPQLQFLTVVDFLWRYRGLFPVAPVLCSTSPVFSRWFAVLGTLMTCPLLVTTGCLELDSVVLQSFRSCMTKLLRPFWPCTSSGFSCLCVFRSFLFIVIESALVAWCYQVLSVLQYII